jgi:small subunit ribosomal protein S20
MAEEKKVKCPSAVKRDKQGLLRNARNRSYKARVSTTIRSFQDAMNKKDVASAKETLKNIFSLVDKGVKTGIYKTNKAGRVKSRLSRIAQQASA